VHEIREIAQAAREVKPDVIILIHGGPIAEPGDAQYVLQRAEGVAGFYGASSMERLPVEVALREVTKQFKSVQLASSNLPA
jgi:predicted TIM-barrel enzyme